MRRRGKFHTGVRLHVFRGSSKRQMRAKNTKGHKERFAGRIFGQAFELRHSPLGIGAIRVDGVGSLNQLNPVHLGRITTDLSESQTMHPPSRVLPFTGFEDVPIPGFGHFMNGLVIPIRPATPTGMMRNLSDRYGRVTILPKPSWHTGRKRIRIFRQLFGPAE